MRDLTDQESKDYQYSVFFTINVKRTDGRILTDDENNMVQEMNTATDLAIKKVMVAHGQGKSRSLGSETIIY